MLWFFAGLLLMIVLGAAYQAAATALEQRRFRPPGQFFDIRGRRLHAIVRGDGPGPVVVVETGRGNPAILWANVSDAVAKLARIIVYDRPGYGWSEPSGPVPRTPAEIAGDLHLLLEKAGLPGPYILVGHSQGGMYARLFAAQYPGDVAGMLLVDARHESLSERIPLLSGATDGRLYRLFGWLLRLGMMRGITRLKPDLMLGQPGTLALYPAALRPVVRAVMIWPDLTPASAAETAGWPAVEAELRAARPLGELPLTVLSRSERDMEGWGYPAELKEQVWQALQECQAELARLAPRARHVIVEGAGHMIPLQRPEVVVEAIRSLLE